MYNSLHPLGYYKVFVEETFIDEALLMIPNTDDYSPYLRVQNAMTKQQWDCKEAIEQIEQFFKIYYTWYNLLLIYMVFGLF